MSLVSAPGPPTLYLKLGFTVAPHCTPSLREGTQALSTLGSPVPPRPMLDVLSREGQGSSEGGSACGGWAQTGMESYQLWLRRPGFTGSRLPVAPAAPPPANSESQGGGREHPGDPSRHGQPGRVGALGTLGPRPGRGAVS